MSTAVAWPVLIITLLLPLFSEDLHLPQVPGSQIGKASFEMDVHIWYGIRSQCLSSVKGHPVFPVLFTEKSTLCPLCVPGSSVRIQVSANVWVYFWVPHCVLFVGSFLLIPVPHTFDYKKFAVDFEVT